jgi:hypothetical protein
MGMKGLVAAPPLFTRYANLIVTEGEDARAEDALALAGRDRERANREQGIELTQRNLASEPAITKPNCCKSSRQFSEESGKEQ